MRKVVPDDAILIPEGAELVFEGVIYDVYQWQQQNFDDSVATFEMLKRPDTVVAICLVDDKIVVLNDEQPHRGTRLGLPGGRVDEGDKSILSAAKREVQEETGFTFKDWKLVHVMQPQAKLEWFIHVYVARNVTHKSDARHDAGERIQVELKSFDDFKALATQRSGFLGEVRYLLADIHKLQDLQQIPTYKGAAVDR